MKQVAVQVVSTDHNESVSKVLLVLLRDNYYIWASLVKVTVTSVEQKRKYTVFTDFGTESDFEALATFVV